MTNTEPYPLSIVLSAYHNKLMCTFSELRQFLNYMTGEQVALWEIPRARTLVAEHLARQFPWLPKIEPPPGFRVDSGNTGKFIKTVTKETGLTTVDVKPLQRGKFQPHKPFEQGPWAKRRA